MQNNPSQNIHTDYVAHDVFKPIAANQLARSIHYDFVITQLQYDNYVAKHAGITQIDVGNLIASDEEGNDGPFDVPVPAPVSIYIAAKTSMPLNFGSRLRKFSSTLNGIVDCSAFTNEGSGVPGLTDGCINVYSQYPYHITCLEGGFNYWSTPEAPVTVRSAYQTNGTCRVGAYFTEGDTDINFGDIPGESYEIICQRAMGNGKIKCEPSQGHAEEPTYTPSVYYAEWMTSSPATFPEYAILSTENVKPGLFQMVRASIVRKTIPMLLEVAMSNGENPTPTGKETCYNFAGTRYTSGVLSAYVFTNSEDGKKIVVFSDNSIIRENIGGGAGGSPIILRDVYVPYSPGNITSSSTEINFDPSAHYGDNKICLYQDGQFTVLANDSPWEFSEVGSTHPHFSFGGNNRLVWNTWYKFYYENNEVGVEITEQNQNKQINLSVDHLVEGVVYEVEINIRAFLGSADYFMVDSGDMGFMVYFYDNLDGAMPSTVTPKKWGDSQNATRAPQVKPNFMLVVEPTDDTQSPPAPLYHGNSEAGREDPVLARAIIHFVKLGSDVYIMSY